VQSKISFVTDTWSTPQMMYSFAGTMAVFIDDEWKINEILMGFKHLSVDDHKGKHAAKAFMKTIVPFSAAIKISCFFLIVKS
jgi:hypothetical protein